MAYYTRKTDSGNYQSIFSIYFRLLNNIIDDNFIVRPQDYNVALNSALTGNEANTQVVFSYVQTYLQRFINA